MFRKISLFIGVLGFFAALVIFGVRAFTANKYPYPSEAYYLNDFADVFSPTTENYLIGEADNLFETTKDINNVGGAQIVFATYLLENRDEVANYDKTVMFREWKIGQNEMGLLAIFYFVKINENTTDNYEFIEFQIEASDKMMIYYPIMTQLNIYNRTIENYLPKNSLTGQFDYNLEIGAASLMNELINVAYQDIYAMSEQVIPQDEFDLAFDEYWWSDSSLSHYKADESLNMIDYYFSPYGTIYDRVIFGTLTAIFVVVSGGAGIFKAKGGSSSGAGLFRHR